MSAMNIGSIATATASIMGAMTATAIIAIAVDE
jgi:hypothetical protein